MRAPALLLSLPVLPPVWLLAVLFAPVLVAWLPLAFPGLLLSAAGAVGRPSDAPALLASASLLLSLFRLGCLLQWWLSAPRDYEPVPPEPQWLTLARLACAMPLAGAGVALKLGALRSLGLQGLFYGRQLGARGLPWVTSWPFDLTAHPWQSGSGLLIVALFLLVAREAPEGFLVAVLAWLGSHVAVVLLEEGLSSPFTPDSLNAPLAEGAHPFYDGSIREMSSAEHLRVVLMTPVAFLRACCFWVGIILYGLFVNALYYFVPGEAERYALLVPATRIAASSILFICGFSVHVRGRQQLLAAQRSCADAGGSFLIVCNHLSYMDILVCASIFGPFAAAARHDLLDWPIVGPVARAWGVVGVVQSSIRERELARAGAATGAASQAASGSATGLSGMGGGGGGGGGGGSPTHHSMEGSDASAGPPPTPGVSSALPPSASASAGGGAAAVLSARARLAGSGVRLPPVLVFPEATCSVGGCLVTFRGGAFVAGVPVLPTTVRYRTPSAFNLAWVAPHSTGGHFLRSMCMWGKRVDVDILPLHVPSASELENASEFAENVRSEMAASLGWPALSGWSVRDAHQLHHDLAAAVESGTRVSVSTILRSKSARGD